ncbi:3-hydroxy-5-methyl-1-naphthoate 3-O-methyltransferase [bioreactor metagenome]|uniref:3-hydroxy-5-methyl-1-naphthoate 3-O-methyltransferase n=1 Tax=bioreactor metagenome TaxID=1076179 RepID=A0A645DMN7_9ZZZZ
MSQDLSRWAEGSAYNIIQNIAIGFQKSQILFTAVKYDIFYQIETGNNTTQAIATSTNLNFQALERLLNALVAIKLLEKNGMYYKNTPISQKHLIHSSEDYYGFLRHNADLWESWGTLQEVLKTGKSLVNAKLHEKDDKFIEDFLLALDWRAKLNSDLVLNELPIALTTKRILKIGAASCRYVLEIAKLHSHIEVVIADFPNIIEVAQKLISSEFDHQNIKLLACNYFEEDYGKDFDIIFIDSIIEENSVMENIESLRKVYNSIGKGGKLVIHQLLINDARTEPQVAALQAINLMLNTPSGNAYTNSDLWVVLKEAGFKDIEFYKTMASSHVIIATKSFIG